MIKAGGRDAQDRPLVIVGLTKENLLRLADGDPILFDATEVGFAGSVMVLAGTTEDDIIETMRQWRMATPATRIRHEWGPGHPGPRLSTPPPS